MSAHLTVLASLGVAILLSPEILVLGLVMACDRRSPRLGAAMYALGAAAGLALGLAIGFLVAPEPKVAAAPAAPTWDAFTIRMLIAGALLTIGAQRAIAALRGAPVDGEAEPSGRLARLTAALKSHVAAKSHGHAPAEPSTGRRAFRAAALGFATMGIHPKCVSVAIAAGHQAMQVTGEAGRALGIGLFCGIAMLPAVAPLAIELVRPGGSAALKESCERFMRTKGRWILAAILVGAGAYVAWNAFRHMP